MFKDKNTIIGFSLIGLLLFGMMYFNRIPRFHHPVFYSDKFSRVTSDAFYVSIEISDPKYNEEEVKSFLKQIGGTEIEVLKDENS